MDKVAIFNIFLVLIFGTLTGFYIEKYEYLEATVTFIHGIALIYLSYKMEQIKNNY